MKTFYADSSDSWMTVLVHSCQRHICNHSNDFHKFIFKNDSSDSFSNFSANISKNQKNEHKAVGINEIEKSVFSVSLSKFIHTSPINEKNYFSDSFSQATVIQLSELSTKRRTIPLVREKQRKTEGFYGQRKKGE